MKKIRVILNGKGAANPQVRAAIFKIREDGQPLEVNCTWEGGDAARFAQEAMNDGVEVLIAGGGDGTINEVVNGVLATDTSPSMALGVLPLGTANDFARGCGIPLEPYKALKLATEGEPVSIDIPSANGVYFAIVASGVEGLRYLDLVLDLIITPMIFVLRAAHGEIARGYKLHLKLDAGHRPLLRRQLLHSRRVVGDKRRLRQEQHKSCNHSCVYLHGLPLVLVNRFDPTDH